MAEQRAFENNSEYVVKDGKRLRKGFTTGSCAAAAATAAAQMLMTGEEVRQVRIQTPGGPVFTAQILEIRIGSGSCRCAVRKDGGDDPDITTGTLIEAEVFPGAAGRISIEGGKGIGRVTKPGLDQPVGEAAINSIPRRMIAENVEKVLDKWRKTEAGMCGEASAGLRIVISAPEGEELAQKTFNPRLGIVGGISILGTTGIVEPMSDHAIVETIRTEMRVQRAQGRRVVVAAPGNYGLSFLQEKYGIEQSEAVQISNFVGESVKMAAEEGFKEFLLVGHIGKLVKVAGGVPDTHSKYGDRRMEILWETASQMCPEEMRDGLQKELLDCVMTDAALEVLDRYGLKERTAQKLARRICGYLTEWSDGLLRAETIVFSNRNRELARSQGAEEMAGKCRR